MGARAGGVDAVEKRIEVWTEKIRKMEIDVRNKDENKEVSLGTSEHELLLRRGADVLLIRANNTAGGNTTAPISSTLLLMAAEPWHVQDELHRPARERAWWRTSEGPSRACSRARCATSSIGRCRRAHWRFEAMAVKAYKKGDDDDDDDDDD